MSIPFIDLNKEYEPIKGDILQALEGILDSKQFVLGKETENLESTIASMINANHAIGCSSGTDALLMALMALDIGQGDEVITSPFTFFATGGCIHRSGATPVFVDIDPDTYNIDPQAIEAAITPKTKAIMPVHIYGQMANMDAISAIAKTHNLHIIEDGAQAILASYTNKDGQEIYAGTVGDIGCFSFYPTKNLGAPGDAGLVSTMDDTLDTQLRQMRNHGQTYQYQHAFVGGNFRIDGFAAATLNIKLKTIQEYTKKRQHNAALYTSGLRNSVKTPHVLEGYNHVYHQYTIQTDQRDELKAHLQSKGIGCNVFYPLPLHLQPCFEYLGYKEGACPVAENAAKNVLSLPIHPFLSEEDIQTIITEITDFII